MKVAFNNDRYKDHPEQESSSKTFLLEDRNERFQNDRFQEEPVKYDKGYLYTDENVDRWNAGNDPDQKFGQPKGYDPKEHKEQNTFDSNTKIFDDNNTLKSFNKQESIILAIIKL